MDIQNAISTFKSNGGMETICEIENENTPIFIAYLQIVDYIEEAPNEEEYSKRYEYIHSLIDITW